MTGPSDSTEWTERGSDYGPADGVPPAGGSGPGWNTNASFGEGPGSGAFPAYPAPDARPLTPASESPRKASRAPRRTVDSASPMGRDPVTDEPFGPTSRRLAGALQLGPLLLALPLGLGRFVMGHTRVAAAQVAIFVVGVVLVLTSVGTVPGATLVAGVWVWALVDGIRMLTGRLRDHAGRLLRP